GPPETFGYDILNECKVILLTPPAIAVLDQHGNILFNFALPAGSTPLGGFVWDYDNKICKLRLNVQRELIVDLSRFPFSINTVTQPMLSRTRWYPVVDRMNGWEFWVERG